MTCGTIDRGSIKEVTEYGSYTISKTDLITVIVYLSADGLLNLISIKLTFNFEV